MCLATVQGQRSTVQTCQAKGEIRIGVGLPCYTYNHEDLRQRRCRRQEARSTARSFGSLKQAFKSRVKGEPQRKFNPSGFLLRKNEVREVNCEKGSLKLRLCPNFQYPILSDPGLTDNLCSVHSLTLLAFECPQLVSETILENEKVLLAICRVVFRCS